ncbi:hypothetical protein [Pseudonocardia sp. GCM10023141]|uniref:hypothetical protein n=1 Tax=Pseudonocardia sp. GCM10023141 TaxID=3252653 RepID=UPI00360CFF19
MSFVWAGADLTTNRVTAVLTRAADPPCGPAPRDGRPLTDVLLVPRSGEEGAARGPAELELGEVLVVRPGSADPPPAG